MKKARMILYKLLFPPKRILFSFSAVSFAALIVIFAIEKTESVPAYIVYSMSAYSLCILIAATPSFWRKIKLAFSKSAIMRKAAASPFLRKYKSDIFFRGSVGVYQGVVTGFLYAVFRIAAGLRYRSVWFISMAVYYLILGGIRAYILFRYHKHDRKSELQCFRVTAWMLFLLNIPMGGMIILMVKTNTGFSYPGYIIYLSALYTFYAMITSVINIVKCRRLGNLVLSAARILNFVAAMMSILGLQTAMISRFSREGEGYRKMMNAVTGGFVWGIVIVVAVYMLVYISKRKKVECLE